MTAYERALQQLYRAPLKEFLAERTRLAGEVRAGGDKTGGAKIAIRRRPNTSVWAVNQLYWQAREAFDSMLAAAARLRKGDNRATREYQRGIATLRKRAAEILTAGGLAVSDATLRRVATSLASIAAVGFAPDPPGALAADRDPPGFESIEVSPKAFKRKPAEGGAPERRAGPGKRSEVTVKHARAPDELAAARDRKAAERARLREARAEQRSTKLREKQREAEVARESRRLRAALRAATARVEARARALTLLEKQLRAAEKAAAEARQVVADLEGKLERLNEDR